MDASSTVEDIRSAKKKLHFEHFPLFAKFLLESRLEDYARESLKTARTLNLPILKYFDSIPDEKLVEMGMESNREFFTCVIENRLDEFVELSVSNWQNDRLAIIARDQIVAEDITLAAYLLKLVLLKFLPQYTNDVKTVIAFTSEVDQFIQRRNALSINAFIEIQQQKLNEINRNLQESESKLLEAQKIAHIGSFEWDLTGGPSYLSPEVLDIFELQGATTLNDFLQHVHLADRERVAAALEKAQKETGNYEIEYRYKKEGKEKVVWSQGIISYAEGKPKSIKGTAMDITEKALLSERLERSEARYRTMVNEVQDYAIIRLSKEGTILNWNLGAEKIKGYKADEIIGKKMDIFYTEADRKNGVPKKFLLEAEAAGRAAYEGWRLRKDGSKFWGNVVLTALHDEEKNVIGFSKVTRDLTQKKNDEDRLHESAARLENKNRELEMINKELESFNYVASHDLQEPLKNIGMFTALVRDLDGDKLSPKGIQLLGRIVSATQRMQTLIDDLLAFSRIQSYSNQSEPVNLNAIIEEIRAGYIDAIQENRLSITWQNLPVVTGVYFQFRQLFDNIIGNAIKYGKVGGKTEISIGANLVKGVAIGQGAEPEKDYYQITVQDNGIGFEQKYAHKIFEIFQRLHGKDEYSGTGIGLAICKKIVQNHKGFITAESKLNEGSTFFVYLPAESPGGEK